MFCILVRAEMVTSTSIRVRHARSEKDMLENETDTLVPRIALGFSVTQKVKLDFDCTCL